MKPADFRRICLSLPEASENAHMSHPDFRVGGKIFATLGYPDENFGAVMLSPEDQAKFLQANPSLFTPAKGAWGERGSTVVRLDAVDLAVLEQAIAAAWKKRTPRRLTMKEKK